MAPVPLTMDWGDGNTLVMFTWREMAEQFLASEWLPGAGIVKGHRAEAFIKLLGGCIDFDWIELVLVNPNPPHEWGQGKFEGVVLDAADFYAHMKEAYRDFLED